MDHVLQVSLTAPVGRAVVHGPRASAAHIRAQQPQRPSREWCKRASSMKRRSSSSSHPYIAPLDYGLYALQAIIHESSRQECIETTTGRTHDTI